MSVEQTSWWEVLKAPLAFLSAPVMLKAFEWWSNRREKRETKQSSAADRREVVMLAEREMLAREQRELDRRAEVERVALAHEAERLRNERRTLERDRDRGWSLARHHYRLACELMHALGSAQQVAEALSRQVDPPLSLAPWPTFTMPADLEAPFPANDR